MTTEVKELLAYFKKFEEGVAIVRNVNIKLVERAVSTERWCCKNAQYWRRNTLEVVGIPTSIRDNVLEKKVCDVFQEIAVDICDRYIQACCCLKDKDQAVIKLSSRKDCLQILRLKRQLRGLDPAEVDLPESGQANIITHMVDLQNLFANIEIDSLWRSFFLDICW